MDFWVGTFLIFILATLQIVLFGWVLGIKKGLAEAREGSVIGIPPFFGWIMKYACPVFLLTIFGMWVLLNVFGYRFDGGEAEFSGYVRDLFIEPNLVALLSVALILTVTALIVIVIACSRRYEENSNP